MYLTYRCVNSEFSDECNSFVTSTTSSPEDITSMVEPSDDKLFTYVDIFSRAILSITTSAKRNKTMK